MFVSDRRKRLITRSDLPLCMLTFQATGLQDVYTASSPISHNDLQASAIRSWACQSPSIEEPGRGECLPESGGVGS